MNSSNNCRLKESTGFYQGIRHKKMKRMVGARGFCKRELSCGIERWGDIRALAAKI
jgi:hypothetical protein